MKYSIGMILLANAVLWVCGAYGISYQEVFLRANKQYKEQEYEKALEAYTSMSNKSSAVWYNSGNCLYHLGKYVDALVAFKRAYHGATREQSQAIDYNITQTLNALGITRPSLSYKEQWYAYSARVVAGLSLLFLQLLFLLLLYATFLCLRYVHTFKKRWLCVMVVVLLSASTVLSGMGLAVKYYHAWNIQALVTQVQSSMFVGPNKKYDTVGTVALADELIIVQERPEWYKVKKGKLFGWIPAEAVAKI